MTIELFILVGPTASGKSKVGIEIARNIGAEIVSMDSMAVYRGMNIGTDKPNKSERESVPHHMIDVCDPWDSFDLGDYIEKAERQIEDITSRKKYVLVVGGTPLYLKGLTEGIFKGPKADWALRKELDKVETKELYQRLQIIDPKAAAKIYSNDTRRIIRALEVYYITQKPISDYQQQFGIPNPSYKVILVGIHRERAELYQRIEKRVENMFDAGLVEETHGLLAHPKGLSHAPSQALGYKEVIEFINRQCDLSHAKELTKRNTRHFAKRQLTWFRRFPIHWIEASSTASISELCEKAIQKFMVSNQP